MKTEEPELDEIIDNVTEILTWLKRRKRIGFTELYSATDKTEGLLRELLFLKQTKVLK